MIQVKVNNIDITNQITFKSLVVVQNITNAVDTASFNVQKAGTKTFIPEYGQEVEIYDGATKIFGGTVSIVKQNPMTLHEGISYNISCVDWTYSMDKLLVARIYVNQTIHDIIADLITSYVPSFTYNNVSSDFEIEKIVFNQIPISTALTRLASIVNSDWYIDENKDVHFFSKYANTAPFNLTDNNGNYIYSTLSRSADGSQVANRIKVRGGEYNGVLFTDIITVVGNDTSSFNLPYKFANLTIELDTGGGFVSQNVGIDFVNDFTTDDVLYNFQSQMIRFENPLSDGNKIRFSGNPKVPVFAVSEDPVSIEQYGKIEKLIRDNSIESNTIARRRANAELYSYSEPVIDATFATTLAGLRAGMLIKVQSDLQNINDELIIKSLQFRMNGHNSFMYTVGLISSKRYDFITLLQSILEPDPQASDEQETTEEIYTDTQIINIQEEIELVTSVENEEVITSSENYVLNPFGVGVNATYVLGDYKPISQTDTKRNGRLNISLVLY